MTDRLILNPGSQGDGLGGTKFNEDFYQTVNDFYLEVSRQAVPKHRNLSVFAKAPNGVQTTRTDIWPRANGTAGQQQIFIAPTAAAPHNIASTDASDDIAQQGAQVLRVRGLISWDLSEVVEDVNMAGLSNVTTANDYVIINTMSVISNGTAGVNVGTITATAIGAGGNVTSQINPAIGDSRSAVIGISRQDTIYARSVYAGITEVSAQSFAVDFIIALNYQPDKELTHFHQGWDWALSSDGLPVYNHNFGVPAPVKGPAIMKIQALSSKADTDVSAGWDSVVYQT